MDKATAPRVPLSHLDELWFQVGGTRCNLTCSHCFISCSPHNKSFDFLSLATVERYLQEASKLGVREFYFTGGEPFLNVEMVAILKRTLEFGPATVLTNGTVLRKEWLEELAEAEKRSGYSLEFRISIDGPTAETNDPIRGEGSFPRIVEGLRLLVDAGFLPILTATRVWKDEEHNATVEQFLELLLSVGCRQPRIKILPTLQLGAEETRTQGYSPSTRLSVEELEGFDTRQLVCEHSRIVTDRGVYVCPLLIESRSAYHGATLSDALGDAVLSEGACTTCYQYGALCANPSSALGQKGITGGGAAS
ncbi:MAG: radical SAM protein [Planctomycetaceae bacterium]